MDIWISTCRKTIPQCSYCGEQIELGEPMVFGKLWMRFTQEGGEVRRWVKNFRWHAVRKKDGQCCWLVSSLESLKQNPPVETRGRRSLQLPEDVKVQRLKILRQRARSVARLRELMLAPLRQVDMDEVIRIGSKIEEMKEKIQLLGGVPKSWA